MDGGPILSNGAQDGRPRVRCSHCHKLARCYKGPLVKIVDDGAGNLWEHFDYYCAECLAATVAEALREDEGDPA